MTFVGNRSNRRSFVHCSGQIDSITEHSSGDLSTGQTTTAFPSIGHQIEYLGSNIPQKLNNTSWDFWRTPVVHFSQFVVAQMIIPDGACKEKLLMIGPSGAGKTAIANRIIHDNFRPITAATVGASFQTMSFTVNSETLRLDI
jgi:hypothetical protein